ncbi:hypothetical protein WJX73_009231 [Symbiochloris irregularis]|uniref:HORMA domain-containing protein n=1 Tax=Symbiochloris irregularis TaxID=706552 RepID=A0AAW1PUS4_9CHLO
MFSFSHNEDGRVEMELSGGKKGAAKNTPFKSADMESIRFQVCRLIRTLVQICRTLDQVPSQRYLFMRLTYTENTPELYEPPFFRATEGQSYFMRPPFHMHVGNVATAYHAVGLHVKSILDSADYGTSKGTQHEPASRD